MYCLLPNANSELPAACYLLLLLLPDGRGCEGGKNRERVIDADGRQEKSVATLSPRPAMPEGDETRVIPCIFTETEPVFFRIIPAPVTEPR